MKKEVRTVCYDEQLQIEAYQLEGIVQPFPMHFHEYYVIGIVEHGKRTMTCNANVYEITKGDIIIFNPNDSHACIQTSDEKFVYRGLNIPKQIVLQYSKEIRDSTELPYFPNYLKNQEEIIKVVSHLHQSIMEDNITVDREAVFLHSISLLLNRYIEPVPVLLMTYQNEVEQVCQFIASHFQDALYLEQLCEQVHLSKSTLLRAFTKNKGVTPYRYLQTVRINEAKRLLEQGMRPVDVAMQVGFSDQSHFTNFFTTFIGITPGGYREIFK